MLLIVCICCGLWCWYLPRIYRTGIPTRFSLVCHRLNQFVMSLSCHEAREFLFCFSTAERRRRNLFASTDFFSLFAAHSSTMRYMQTHQLIASNFRSCKLSAKRCIQLALMTFSLSQSLRWIHLNGRRLHFACVCFDWLFVVERDVQCICSAV